MNQPNQTLIHLTSRGTRVRTQNPGNTGKFINLSTQPISNINKYGLMQYSIPKTMDIISETNRKFVIVLTTKHKATIQIPVTLPLMDYYKMSVNKLGKTQACLAEVLQTSINWAIQKAWSDMFSGNGPSPLNDLGLLMFNRISCIVRVKPDGRFQFIFGYRGRPSTAGMVQDADDIWQYNGAAVASNTGAPWPVLADAPQPNRGFRGIGAAATNAYAFVDYAGRTHNDSHDNADTLPTKLHMMQLSHVEFHQMSQRLQFMLGFSGPNMSGTAAYLQDEFTDMGTGERKSAQTLAVQRGRVIICNYHLAQMNAGDRTGIIYLDATIPPNVYPPSFMFLALLAQGTKSKVLGHDAERGGWAVPTASNQFKSKYCNFPNTDAYHVDQVRQTMALWNISSTQVCTTAGAYLGKPEREKQAHSTLYPEDDWKDADLPHFFDQLPVPPNAEAYDNQGAGGYKVFQADNYSSVTDFAINGGLVAPYIMGSTMIRFGDRAKADRTTLDAQAPYEKRPRSSQKFGLSNQSGVVEAPTFTVSMIDPNWLYTDVPNSTVQSIHVQLMWGDTNENVDDIAGEPVQFTLIASQ